jgi:hypothetical protein
MDEFEKATAAKKKLVKQLADQPGIVGIGIGWSADGKRCLQLNVDTKFADVATPRELDGFRVEVVRSGSVRFHADRKTSRPST